MNRSASSQSSVDDLPIHPPVSSPKKRKLQHHPHSAAAILGSNSFTLTPTSAHVPTLNGNGGNSTHHSHHSVSAHSTPTLTGMHSSLPPAPFVPNLSFGLPTNNGGYSNKNSSASIIALATSAPSNGAQPSPLTMNYTISPPPLNFVPSSLSRSNSPNFHNGIVHTNSGLNVSSAKWASPFSLDHGRDSSSPLSLMNTAHDLIPWSSTDDVRSLPSAPSRAHVASSLVLPPSTSTTSSPASIRVNSPQKLNMSTHAAHFRPNSHLSSNDDIDEFDMDSSSVVEEDDSHSSLADLHSRSSSVSTFDQSIGTASTGTVTSAGSSSVSSVNNDPIVPTAVMTSPSPLRKSMHATRGSRGIRKPNNQWKSPSPSESNMSDTDDTTCECVGSCTCAQASSTHRTPTTGVAVVGSVVAASVATATIAPVAARVSTSVPKGVVLAVAIPMPKGAAQLHQAKVLTSAPVGGQGPPPLHRKLSSNANSPVIGPMTGASTIGSPASATIVLPVTAVAAVSKKGITVASSPSTTNSPSLGSTSAHNSPSLTAFSPSPRTGRARSSSRSSLTNMGVPSFVAGALTGTNARSTRFSLNKSASGDSPRDTIPNASPKHQPLSAHSSPALAARSPLKRPIDASYSSPKLSASVVGLSPKIGMGSIVTGVPVAAVAREATILAQPNSNSTPTTPVARHHTLAVAIPSRRNNITAPPRANNTTATTTTVHNPPSSTSPSSSRTVSTTTSSSTSSSEPSESASSDSSSSHHGDDHSFNPPRYSHHHRVPSIEAKFDVADLPSASDADDGDLAPVSPIEPIHSQYAAHDFHAATFSHQTLMHTASAAGRMGAASILNNSAHLPHHPHPNGFGANGVGSDYFATYRDDVSSAHDDGTISTDHFFQVDDDDRDRVPQASDDSSGSTNKSDIPETPRTQALSVMLGATNFRGGGWQYSERGSSGDRSSDSPMPSPNMPPAPFIPQLHTGNLIGRSLPLNHESKAWTQSMGRSPLPHAHKNQSHSPSFMSQPHRVEHDQSSAHVMDMLDL